MSGWGSISLPGCLQSSSLAVAATAVRTDRVSLVARSPCPYLHAEVSTCPGFVFEVYRRPRSLLVLVSTVFCPQSSFSILSSPASFHCGLSVCLSVSGALSRRAECRDSIEEAEDQTEEEEDLEVLAVVVGLGSAGSCVGEEAEVNEPVSRVFSSLSLPKKQALLQTDR